MKTKKSGYICPNCGKDRWKTKESGKAYICRECGYVQRYHKCGMPYKFSGKKNSQEK